MTRPLIILCCLLATASVEQEGRRAGDVPFSQADLVQVLSGQVLEFHDGSLASYRADGGYAYAYAPGEPPFAGTYTVTGDSSVCVEFDNGFDRCDRIVRNGDRLMLIIARGDRFPVKSRTPID
jgi:hypothetical protein